MWTLSILSGITLLEWPSQRQFTESSSEEPCDLSYIFIVNRPHVIPVLSESPTFDVRPFQRDPRVYRNPSQDGIIQALTTRTMKGTGLGGGQIS